MSKRAVVAETNPGEQVRALRADIAAEPTAEPRGISKELKIGGGILGAIALLAIVAAQPNSADTSSNFAIDGISADPMIDGAMDANMTMDANMAIDPAPAQPSTPWDYRTDEDKVRGKTSYYASSTSTNSVYLDAPYSGGSTLGVTVRQSPAHGADVLFVLSSGQLLCRSYDGCYATVRFDDNPPERVSMSGAADHSSDTIFVDGARSFISKLKKAKKMVIEVEIYQAGRPQFEFDVQDLKWEH